MHRRTKGFLASLGLVLALALLLAWRAFPAWWEARLVRSARQYLESGDLRGAYLSAHEALHRNGASIPAVEMMVLLALRSNSPEEINWAERLVALQPTIAKRRLQLAEAALRHDETFTAKHALEGIAEKDQTFRFHQASAALALISGRLSEAQDHLESANQLQPNDPATRLMREKVRLAAPDPAIRAKAHERLRAFTSDETLRLEAYRSLLTDAQAHGRFEEAEQLAQSLSRLPEALFADRLAYLEEINRPGADVLTGESHSRRFENELGWRESEAQFDSQAVFALGSWLNSHGYPEKTIAWLTKLPESERSLPSARLLAAEASAGVNDWAAVESQVAKANWGPLEYLRFAFVARASLAQTGARDDRFLHAWQAACQASGNNRENTGNLARQAEAWGWTTESEDLWWILANQPNGSLAILQHLFALARKRGATDDLARISERIYRLDPTDLVARNNFAQLTMLVGHSSPETRQIAQDNATQHPDDWALLSTFALALHLEGRDQEGLALLLRLPWQARIDPQMSLYFGLLYAATGQPEDARASLARAKQAELLPEEARLAQGALPQ